MSRGRPHAHVPSPRATLEYVEDSLDRLFARQGPFTPDRLPVPDRPPPPLPPSVPAALESIVERALAKDPAERWPTAATVAEAVRSIR